MKIDIKNFKIEDAINAAKEFYGKAVVNFATNPPEVWVTGEPKIEQVNKFLQSRFAAYPGASPKLF